MSHNASERAADAPSVRLLSSSAADIQQWSAFVEAVPEATIYHDLAWREIFELTFGYKSRYLIAERSDGSACGVLPLFQVPGLLGRPRLVAVPFRDRGGILHADTAAFTALVQATKDACRAQGAASAEIKTTRPYPEGACQASGLLRTDHWTHSVVDMQAVAGAPLDKVLAKSMRNVRKATRAKLRVHRHAPTRDAIADWYRVYRRSQRALGVPSFPEKLFRAIGSRLENKTRIYLVRRETGEAIAGCIVFCHGNTATYGYSASLPEARDLRPNDIMLYELYQDLLERGVDIFDFGSDSPDQDGLLRFKRKWLARQHGIPSYHVGRLDIKKTDSSASRYRLVRTAIRLLPPSVSALLTTPLVRYFG